MAIDAIQWRQITESGAKGKALAAGYPDLLVHLPNLPERVDSRDIQEHHDVAHPIAHSGAAFESIGLKLHVIDRQVLQGEERIVDLNWPQDLGRFDLVIDPGTTEHCFNIPEAWCNLGRAIKEGGFLSQALPMAMFNHGYWNVNPVAMLDFWTHNGFEVKECVIRHSEGIFDMSGLRRQRLKGVPDGAVISMLAKRIKVQDFGWPQQELPS